MTGVFTYRSVIDAPVSEVFAWHERPEAVLDLMPSSGLARIERQVGGIADGGRVDISIGVGPLRMTWQAHHFGYVRDRQFCDEQIRGPFKVWRHTHRFEPLDAGRTLYEDQVEFAARGGALLQPVLSSAIRPMLILMFARRHRIVASRLGRRSGGSKKTRPT